VLGAITGAMCLGFAANAWFAWSGMETVALGWILMRAVRLAGELREPDARQTRAARAVALDLAVAGAIAPLIRPEGLLTAGNRRPRPRGPETADA